MSEERRRVFWVGGYPRVEGVNLPTNSVLQSTVDNKFSVSTAQLSGSPPVIYDARAGQMTKATTKPQGTTTLKPQTGK